LGRKFAISVVADGDDDVDEKNWLKRPQELLAVGSEVVLLEMGVTEETLEESAPPDFPDGGYIGRDEPPTRSVPGRKPANATFRIREFTTDGRPVLTHEGLERFK
jgi:hypothetical protein